MDHRVHGRVFCLWSSHRFISCPAGQGAYRAAIPSHERVCSIHFGSLAIYYQWKNLVDVWSFVQTQGLESTVIGILQRFPFSMALIVFFVIVTMISFVTLVDPMTSVLATISTKGISAEEEAPKFLKVLWGGNMGGVALAVITLCGISALRGMFVFGGVLMMLLTIILCWCIVKEGQNILARNKREDTP